MELSTLNIVHYLENKLNSALEMNMSNPVLNNERETFAFKLFLDAGDYKSFDYIKQGYTIADEGFESVNPTNRFCNYINGILTIGESNVEGADFPIITFSTMLELLVPLRSLDDTGDSAELVGAIRDVLDEALSINEYGSFEGYNMGVSYSLAGTGQRDLKAKIGDSLSLYCYISFAFVSEGVNSSDYKLEIKDYDGVYQEIDTQRKGFSRVSVLETEVSSEPTTGEAGCVQGNSVFTINFDKPVQKTIVDAMITDYLVFGENPVRDVRLTIPVKGGTLTSNRKMILSEVAHNTEKVLNASQTVSMVDAL